MEEEIFSTILTVSALLLLLSGVVVVVIINYKRKQQDFIREKKLLEESFGRQLLEAKVEMQEHTFGLIGSELHDNVGQLLSSTSMLLGVARRSLPSVPPALSEAEDTLVTAIREIRGLSKTFDRDWLSKFNLVENLTIEINRINASSEIHAVLVTHLQDMPIGVEQQLLLFRIIQEGLQNAIKHANPKNLRIIIEADAHVHIRIEDDGFGLPAEHKEGLGTLHMKQRTALLHGSIQWICSPPGGCIVDITLPTQKPNE